MISKKFVWLVMAMGVLLALSVPAEAQRRGGGGGRNGGGSNAGAVRNSGGNRGGGNVGRSYGTPRNGGGYAVARRPMPTPSPSYRSNRAYNNSFARPIVGQRYYRRGNLFGYYGNGLFIPIYDRPRWQSVAAYATMVAADTYMFRQQVPDDISYDYDEYSQQGQQMALPPAQPVYPPSGGEQYSPTPYRPQPGTRIPSSVEIQPTCPSGQVMFRNDTGSDVDVSAPGVSVFVMLAGGNSCRDWVSGLQWNAHKHSTMATEDSGEAAGSRLVMNPTPICFEGDNQGVVHLRNNCTR